MPEVGESNEPLTPVALFGRYSALWKRIMIMYNGYLRVDLDSKMGEKMGMPDWHLDRYSDVAINEALEAGDPTLALTAIPSGDIVAVQMVTAACTSDTITRLSIRLHDATDHYPLNDELNPTSGKWFTVVGPFDLEAGDYLEVKVWDADDGDTVQIRAWGRQIQS